MKNMNQQIKVRANDLKAPAPGQLNPAQSQDASQYDQDALNARVNNRFATTQRYLEIIEMGGHLGC